MEQECFHPSSEMVRLMYCCIHHTTSPGESPFVLLAPINLGNRKHQFSFWPLSVFLTGHELISLYSDLCRGASSPCPLLPFLQLCPHAKNYTDCRTQANTRESLWLCFLTFSWIPSSSPAKYKMGTLSSEAATHCRTACSCLF